MMPQHIDNFREHAWQQNLLDSTAVDAAKRLLFDDLLLYQDNPLVRNFEDWSILNDFEFGFIPSPLPSLSSPLESKPESPISSSSFATAEDPFDETDIDPNILSCHLYNEPVTTSSELLLDLPDLLSGGDPEPGSSQPGIGHHTSSLREIQDLYDIAMPARSQSPHGSDSTSSPEPELEVEMQTRKRSKQQRSAKSKAKQLSSKRQIAHNIIEKRYRNNLNNKIAALQNCLPSLRTKTKEKSGDIDSMESDLGGQNEPQKLNKATVLSKAIEYISHLEKQAESLSNENTALQSKVTALEGLILTRRKGGVGIQRLRYS